MPVKYGKKMIATLFSGGKDSTLALHRMESVGRRTDLLITMISENDFSYMFHKPNVMWTKLQAEALGIRQVFYKTKGVKEEELADLEKTFVENKVTELITGAVASSYQKERIEAICKRLNIVCHSPLWKIEPLEELNELSVLYEVIITQVAAEGFDESMLGSRVDSNLTEKLIQLNKKYRTNMLFEGGEAESFVLDAPLFKKGIEITKSHIEREGTVARLIIDEARLVQK
ncbi:MAG: diphthine--ammonia ligase [Candidatus Micrarchaeota archaeon]|nr:diphthine--ammonia ligase [Candidatus Micrarchaeota archaeon]